MICRESFGNVQTRVTATSSMAQLFYFFSKFQIMQNKFQLPAVQKVSETDLDHYTRQYLQTLVNHNVLVS